MTLAGKVFTVGEGVNVHVAEDGQGVLGDRDRVTVPLYAPIAVKESVYDAVFPAVTLCELGEALSAKFAGPLEL